MASTVTTFTPITNRTRVCREVVWNCLRRMDWRSRWTTKYTYFVTQSGVTGKQNVALEEFLCCRIDNQLINCRPL